MMHEDDARVDPKFKTFRGLPSYEESVRGLTVTGDLIATIYRGLKSYGKGNLEADYFLFINGKAVGVLEAKREETDAFASEVCEQAALYARSVPNIYQAYQKPLPFIFTSNGKELYCCDFREQDSVSGRS